jgi:hypothetical protein
MYENRVLRKIIGCKKGEIMGDWIKLHNEELYSLCFSQNIMRMFRSRWMRQAGHVTLMRV